MTRFTFASATIGKKAKTRARWKYFSCYIAIAAAFYIYFW
jgi:hypothetical protein